MASLFVWSLILYTLLLSCNPSWAERNEETMDDIIADNHRMQDVDRVHSLSARSGYTYRKRLPASGAVFGAGLRETRLSCGDTFTLPTEGYVFFKMNHQGNDYCHIAFLGSRNDGCTVGVICDGTVTLGRTEGKTCGRERMIMSDGTEGSMTGCGTFKFDGYPRMPRNNGTDVYLSFLGKSDATCLALCIEDVREQSDLKPPKRITKRKDFTGFQFEDSCTCGKRNDYGRIVGGKTAFKNEFPWIGGVVFKSRNHQRKPFCGGSLINDKYFLSAAHCFAIQGIEPHEIQVVLHAHVFDKRKDRWHPNDNDPVYQSIPGWDLPQETDESEGSIRLDIEEIQNHPLFNKHTFDYDIALLKLKTKVNLKENLVGPVCLPLVKDHFKFKDGDTMVVAGWGRPDENAPAGSRSLQKLDILFMGLRKCKRYTPASQRHICAGIIEGGKDACAGDSGGPLIQLFKPETKQYMLTGIVSAGSGCARKNNMGLYTDVQELIQWVYYYTRDAVWCKRD